MKRVLGMCGLLLLATPTTRANAPLDVSVAPLHSFAPATVSIRTRIEPDPANRKLTVVADGPDFYRSSEIQLEGDKAPRTMECRFADVPGGEYEISATLIDNLGRHRAVVRRSTTVLGRF